MTKRLLMRGVSLITIVLFSQTLDYRIIHVFHSLAHAAGTSSVDDSLSRAISSWSRLARGHVTSGDEKLYVLDEFIYEGYKVVIECILRGPKPIYYIGWQWRPTYFSVNAVQITGLDYLYPTNIELFIDTSKNYYYEEMTGLYSRRSYLHLPSVTRNASGTYVCYDMVNEETTQIFRVNIQNSSEKAINRPSLVIIGPLKGSETEIDSNIIIDLVPSGSHFQIVCNQNVSSDNSTYFQMSLPPNLPVHRDPTNKQSYYENGVLPLENSRFTLIKNLSNERKQWLIADVQNASYLDTGMYACDPLRKSLIVIHHIYVIDKMQKILPPAERRVTSSSLADDSKAVVVVFQFEGEQYLGCGPTDPSVTIHLLDSQRRTLASSDTTVSSSIWAFQSFIGFQLTTANSWDIEGDHFCSVANGSQERRFKIKVIGIEVYASHGKSNLTEFEKLVLTCQAKTIESHYADLTWHWKPFSAKEDFTYVNERQIKAWNCTRKDYYDEQNSFFSKSITCENTPLEAAGMFECREGVLNSNFSAPIATYNLAVVKKPYHRPSVEGKSEETRDNVDPSGNLTLRCTEKASYPVAESKWYVFQQQEDALQKGLIPTRHKEWIPVSNNSELYQIQVAEHSTELTIRKPDNYSAYMCEFENSFGVARKRFIVQVENSLLGPETKTAIISVFSLVLLALLLVCFIIYRRRRKVTGLGVTLQRNLTQLLEGNVSQINPDIPIDDQVECLPYESTWEFPEDSLFLEKQLGCGHFGRVVKARATGIVPSVPSETMEVAVKMVKSRCDLMELKSLIGELKILVHLGSHLNVVNLLGAVTKNIEKGALMVIVEYCRNGNLKDYLINNRSSFVNELDDDGNLKPLTAPKQQNIDPAAIVKDDRLHKQYFSKCGEETRNSVITTSDLMEWSFEIASGMNYLSRKKVIHGDLAARNVLLADDNVVKIADFGLARKFYQDSSYIKKGKEPMPVKWMAIESLQDRKFSSKSDVWSFGVTLWELFSLGHEPYADIQPPQLLRILLTGYRLSKPEFAPNIIFDMMSSCWKANPEERSTFDRYEQTIGNLLPPELLAMYNMSYDRYGYITLPNDSIASDQAASLDDQQVEGIQQQQAHGYLEIKRSINDDDFQPSVLQSDICPTLLNSSPYLILSDIDAVELDDALTRTREQQQTLFL